MSNQYFPEAVNSAYVDEYGLNEAMQANFTLINSSAVADNLIG